MRTSILEWVETSAERYPDKIAFSDVNTDITFAVLLNKAMAIGSCLSACVLPTSPVAVLSGRSILTPIGFMGVLYSGCYYVPLDPASPIERLNTILSLIDTKVILADRQNLELASKLDFSGSIIAIEDAMESRVDNSKLKLIRMQSTDIDPLYVIFTSGSTGVPKGVVTSHRAMYTFITGLVDALGIDHTDIIGSQAPLDYVGAVKDLYTGLFTGATVFIIPKTCFSVPEKLFSLLNERKVTSIAWTVAALVLPTMQGIFDDCQPPQYLRRVCFTGAVMPCKYLRIWQEHLPDVSFVNLYGPTEVTACCSYHIVDGLVNDDDSIPIGIPFKNYRMFVLNEDNTKAVTGELGELCVGGIAISEGYYNAPERTNECFVQNPLHGLYRDIIYKTGDLCIQRPDGVFEYHGRKDRQVKVHGYRVELGEVEEAAKALAGVGDCCCLYDDAQERLCLFYSGHAYAKDITLALRKKLPAYMIPRKYIQLDELPIMSNMKIDMRKLSEMMAGNA